MIMQNLQKGSHCVYKIAYKIIWFTKYHKSVLYGPEAVRIRAIIKELCNDLKVQILKGVIRSDHVELVVSIPPTISISSFIRKAKGKSAYFILQESERIQKQYPARHLWARGYCVTTDIEDTSEIAFQYLTEIEESSSLD